MASKKKADTARANGAKSRGPKSAETREKSSRNALKHGCTARHTTLLACEDPEEFKKLLADHMAMYQPANPVEVTIVEEIFNATWRIRRLQTIEAALMDYEMARQEPELEKKLTHFDVGIHMALSFKDLADESRSISLISRYESRLHRIRDRAQQRLTGLRQFQSGAAAPQPLAPEIAEPESPAPTPPAAQTQTESPVGSERCSPKKNWPKDPNIDSALGEIRTHYVRFRSGSAPASGLKVRKRTTF